MADAALLSVRGLTRRFGGLTAVGGVDLDLHEGEVHAVIGTNGAGKSTLVNMLSGELAASAGRIALAGQDVTRRSEEHTSELQSQSNLVCRLLLEKNTPRLKG